MKIFKKRKKGFTLIELLAVIVILAIIIAIAIPTVSRLIENSRENAFKASARNILKKIQTTAVSTGKTSGYIDELDISGNNLSGTWSYDDTTKKATVCGLTDGKVGIIGNNGCITSDDNINVSAATFKEIKISDIFASDKLNSYSRLSTDGNYILDNDNRKDTQPNNYVWYSGRLWRAYKKDTTGVYLYTEYSQTSIAFGNSSTDSSVFTNINSYMYTWLNNNFLSTLSNSSTVLDTVNWDTRKYNDTTFSAGTAASSKVGLFSVSDYNSLIIDNSAKLGYCTLPGGVVDYTIDQAQCENTTKTYCYYGELLPDNTCQYAGWCYNYDTGETSTNITESDCWNNNGEWYYNDTYTTSGYWQNKNSSYLDTSLRWWLLTPYANDSKNVYNIYNGDINGSFYSQSGFTNQVKPVIKIKSSINIVGGNGTKNVPYIVDEISGKSVGEYVIMPTKLDTKQIWRIQDVSGNNLKLIMNGVYYNNVDPQGKFDNSSDNFNNAYVKTTLNSADSIFTQAQLDKLSNTTFYLGKYFYDYRTTTTDKTYADVTAKVGLPKIGDVLSAQNIIKSNGEQQQTEFWTLTPSSNWANSVYFIWTTDNVSSAGGTSPTRGLRPVVTINNSLITKGNGTFNDPYIVQ